MSVSSSFLYAAAILATFQKLDRVAVLALVWKVSVNDGAISSAAAFSKTGGKSSGQSLCVY